MAQDQAGTRDSSGTPGSAGGEIDWNLNDPYPKLTGNYLEELLEEEDKDGRFKVLDVDLQAIFNRFEHHTFKYEDRGMIIRRGQEFTIQIKVDKPFERDQDVIKLLFTTGERPRESRGTMFLVTPGKDIDVNEASAAFDYIDILGDTSTIRVRVNLPCDCVIGRFSLVIRLYNKDEDGAVKFTKYKVEEPITVLFNPWCKEDTVYLEDEDERKEYVLSQTGSIYVGSSSNVSPRPWVFGQFDRESLEAALYILEIGSLSKEAQGNPVRVSRSISAMVNSNDDKGILTGKWSGSYRDGTSPTAWNGSVRILEEYMRTKRAVKYGQCWVFSGVVTTVARALGIPTRSVTNFDSAHDSDASMTVDFHYTPGGDQISWMDDSVWNFHVWNETWFKRPDLPDGNDGWQAVDATPQEESDDCMQCGPAPVRAIKTGNVFYGYDSKFVYGEVNGDAVSWMVTRPGERSPFYLNEKQVGKKISTKAVGKRERLDITKAYKYPEGSTEERDVAKKVSLLSSRRKNLQELYRKKESDDVTMTVQGQLKPNMDAEFIFKAVNKSKEIRTVKIKINVVAKYYTGVTGDKISKRDVALTLQPLKEDEFRSTVKGSDWLNKVEEDACIALYVIGNVVETSQPYMYKETYATEKPQLQVELQTFSTPVSKPFDITVKFKNPLDISLTNACLLIEGAGFQKVEKIQLDSDIKSGEEVVQKVTMTPKAVGEGEIIASLNSRQLVGIFGTTDIVVVE